MDYSGVYSGTTDCNTWEWAGTNTGSYKTEIIGGDERPGGDWWERDRLTGFWVRHVPMARPATPEPRKKRSGWFRRFAARISRLPRWGASVVARAASVALRAFWRVAVRRRHRRRVSRREWERMIRDDFDRAWRT